MLRRNRPRQNWARRLADPEEKLLFSPPRPDRLERPRAFSGPFRHPLNALGLSQAQDAALALASCPVDLIVASPLVRALRTAEIVAQRIGKPVLLDDDLKDLRNADA